jgi:hypothetical protein
MPSKSSNQAITIDGRILRGPDSRRADAQDAVDSLGLPYEVETDVPMIAAYTDFDPEPTWILALGDAEQAKQVEQLLDRKG